MRVLSSARMSAGRVRFAPPGPSGTRRGTVEVERGEAGAVTLRERGRFRFDGGREVPYTDALRFEPRGAAVAVAHVRRGPRRPVPLVRLEPRPDGTLVSVAAHRCGSDAYTLVAYARGEVVELEWTVRGPEKRGSIRVTYAPAAVDRAGASERCTDRRSSGRLAP